MKEIKIKNFSKSKKDYHVYLGNGTCNVFSSVRDVNCFLASTNNFLTTQLHEISLLKKDVSSAFSDLWFYFDKPKMFPLQRACESSLQLALDSLEIAVNRAAFTNGNYFVFTHFLNVSENLENCIRVFASVYSSTKNRNGIYIMDSLLRRVMLFRYEVENYGKRSTTILFKVPTHISEDKSYIPELPILRVA